MRNRGLLAALLAPLAGVVAHVAAAAEPAAKAAQPGFQESTPGWKDSSLLPTYLPDPDLGRDVAVSGQIVANRVWEELRKSPPVPASADVRFPLGPVYPAPLGGRRCDSRAKRDYTALPLPPQLGDRARTLLAPALGRAYACAAAPGGSRCRLLSRMERQGVDLGGLLTGHRRLQPFSEDGIHVIRAEDAFRPSFSHMVDMDMLEVLGNDRLQESVRETWVESEVLLDGQGLLVPQPPRPARPVLVFTEGGAYAAQERDLKGYLFSCEEVPGLSGETLRLPAGASKDCVQRVADSYRGRVAARMAENPIAAAPLSSAERNELRFARVRKDSLVLGPPRHELATYAIRVESLQAPQPNEKGETFTAVFTAWRQSVVIAQDPSGPYEEHPEIEARYQEAATAAAKQALKDVCGHFGGSIEGQVCKIERCQKGK